MKSFKQYIREEKDTFWNYTFKVAPNPEYTGPPKATTTHVGDITAPLTATDDEVIAKVEQRYPHLKVVKIDKKYEDWVDDDDLRVKYN